MQCNHRIRQGEPGLPIPPRMMVPSALEQNLGRVGSLPNNARKLTEQLYATSRVLMLCPHCALQTCNAAHTQMAASERIVSKTRLDPIFCPWLIKYGGKSGFSLYNSVSETHQKVKTTIPFMMDNTKAFCTAKFVGPHRIMVCKLVVDIAQDKAQHANQPCSLHLCFLYVKRKAGFNISILKYFIFAINLLVDRGIKPIINILQI